MITIENEKLRVAVSPLGGTLSSVVGRESGIEYLWQGDAAYWTGRAPNLFPFVGRLYEKRYTLHGRSCPMALHGFLSQQEMTAGEISESRCVLRFSDNAATRAVYPFRFDGRLAYALEDDRILIRFQLVNRSAEILYFALGGHPGFNVPLTPGLRFEDYALTFDEPSLPGRVRFSAGGLTTGIIEPFALENGVRLPLRHDLFSRDAIVLTGAPRAVTLASPKDIHGVRVSCPQMPYLGFWHTPETDAPFVCIEPWSALPGREGTVEELTNMQGMTPLAPGQTYENRWSVQLW